MQQVVLPIKDSNVLKEVQDTLLNNFKAGRRNYTIFQVGKATLLRVSDVMGLINIGRKSRDFSHGMDRLLLTSFRAFFYFIVLLIIDILLNDLLAHIP